MQWYYSKNGTQLGPVPQGELVSKLASGEVSSSDLVWKDGMADWIPASQVAELRVIAEVPASPAVSAGPGAPVDSPYVAPVNPYSPTSSPNHEIPNYLWQSIVVTILCCWPLGIPAIVFAAKVDGLKARGDIAAAMAASANAKRWTWIAFGLGLAVIVIYAIIMITAGATGNLQ